MRDEAACVRGFLLDYLRDGPAKLDDLYQVASTECAFTRQDVQRGLDALCVDCKVRPTDGELFVLSPRNDHAIWWAKKANARRFVHQATGGHAA